jgi:hypothetical protein
MKRTFQRKEYNAIGELTACVDVTVTEGERTSGNSTVADRNGRKLGESDTVTVRGVVHVRFVITPIHNSTSADRREFRRALEKAGGVFYNGPDEFRGRHGMPIVCEATEAIEVSFVPDCVVSVLSCRFVSGAAIVTNAVAPQQSRGSGELSESAKRHAKLNRFQRSAVEKDARALLHRSADNRPLLPVVKRSESIEDRIAKYPTVRGTGKPTEIDSVAVAEYERQETLRRLAENREKPANVRKDMEPTPQY